MPSRTSPGVSYDRSAPRRPVNLSLNTDLLAQVREVTPNLSATVEILLGDYLQSARQQREDEQRRLDGVIDAVNDLHTRHGFLSDEFSML
ncbi:MULTISPECIES: type II toxin-antitoxin system CcdA family antitoxin [Acetobacteraceae]|uniref:Type II toxin-antitoxin system CcdA family antitoxin n=1 Tax=Gluconacetobacter diazotrophicus TaxID=33996 RepID=A0A7W4NIG2_GLUDI|nr:MULTISPECIES: type II toxin-antitoxin system CcdA family antitoxin [Acetobacteraceae]MBB2158322.1 type II toxin-antitoxin system CcdA family antitoxin [Gluconacetobacter diazotrophicus]